VDAAAALSRDDAIRLARSAGVWTATVGNLVRLGERVRVTVRVYDVTTRRLLTSAAVDARPDSTLPTAFGSLADQILDVAGAPRSSLRDVEPPTRSLAAYEAYVDGVAARSRWDMPAAVDAFRRAVAADSSFALAYYEWSGALLTSEWLSPESRFLALADSAHHYASSRPAKERLLIQAYHAWLHGDMPRARDLYGQVLALDSTVTDAWVGLADASWTDLTLHRDARGRDSLAASFTTALRSYERALALDQSDHRLFGNLASILTPAGVAPQGGRGLLPAYREPPETINRLFMRTPARAYAVVYTADTLALVPAESLTARFSPRVLDSLRARARRRAESVIERWLRVAPTEGQPHLLLAELRSADKDYGAAVAALDRAIALGASSPVPLEQMKLALLLDGRRLAAATAYADSLQIAGRTDSLLRDAGLTASPHVNAAYVGGRLTVAGQVLAHVYATARRLRVGADQEPARRVNEVAGDLSAASHAELLTRARLLQLLPELERRLDALPEGQRRGARAAVGRLVAFAAAPLGDTALVRRWLPAAEPPARRGAEAWAAAVQGDRATAERLLAAARADTGGSVRNAFALARAAELVGRPQDALHHYGRIDSLEYQSMQVPDTDWLLLVRSYPGRAAMYQTVGDTARAREYYQRFVELWRDADPPLRAEVERAERALGAAPRGEPH
jgi:tetratricopeptide (TPR) repeat protein